MKKLNYLWLAAFSLLILNSCSNKENETYEETSISQDVLSKLQKAHFSIDNAKAITFMGEKGIAVEDMFLSYAEIDELAEDYENGMQKQYRTTNLVKVNGGSRTITMSVDPALGSIGSQALDATIAMYNAENLELNFTRVQFGLKGKRKANIEVTEFFEMESGGFITLGRAAGFPTRKGDPAKGFGINSRWFELLNPSLNEVTGTFAHEVGHCIGLRHTDYMTRESCGQNVNEGSAGVGAIHIAGTPTVSDATSLMQACGPASSFNNNDKIALDVIY